MVRTSSGVSLSDVRGFDRLLVPWPILSAMFSEWVFHER